MKCIKCGDKVRNKRSCLCQKNNEKIDNHKIIKVDDFEGKRTLHIEVYGKNKVKKGTFLLDAELYEKFEGITFSISSNGYVRVHKKGKAEYLHRFIMNPKKGLQVDHINGVKTDNRLKNLRICTQKNNLRNTRKKKGNYKGVYESEHSWIAQIRLDNGKRKHIGSFETEEEAALAYNEFATKIYGEFARLNVVNTPKKDWVKKERKIRFGEGVGNSKLTDKDVMEMRSLYHHKIFSMKKLSEIYGIGGTTARQAIRGDTWKHLPVLDKSPSFKRKTNHEALNRKIETPAEKMF